jgi:hypothetical protein
MNLAALMIAALVWGQVEHSDVKQQALILFEQAEFALKQERDPARRAHGAIILAGLAKDIEASRAEALLRLAARVLPTTAEDSVERERKRTGRTPRIAFRSPYDSDALWKKLLEQAARLRVELVGEFLAQIKGNQQWKASVLSQLAQTVKDDERASSELVEMGLSQGVSFSTVSLLFDLRERAPERADALFRSALKRAVRQRDFDFLYWLGAYALPGVNLPSRFPLVQPPAPDPALSRIYIEALINVMSKVVAQARQLPSHIYRALVAIRPYAEQFTPDSVSQIDSLLTLVVSRLSPEQIAQAELEERERTTPDTERIEDLEKKAQLTRDDKTFDDLMAHAAFLAKEQDFERALSLASKLKDPTVRREMKDLIHYQAAIKLSEKGHLDLAQTHALAIEQPERLAVAVSAVLEKLNDEGQAPVLLAQAQARIERLPTAAAKGRAFLYLAGPVIAFDRDQGRLLLTRAIDLFNATHADLNGAAESVIQIETGDFATGAVVGSYDLAPVVIAAFKKLTEADAEVIHAPLLAAGWKSEEIRAIAQAAVALSLLERVKQPS